MINIVPKEEWPEKSTPNTNKFNHSQNIANYSFNLQDDSMIFVSFDSADIFALKNVENSICL